MERLLRPGKLSEIDSAALSRLQTRLRGDGLRESSIATHLRHIKAALNWAHQVGMLVQMPKVQMPKVQMPKRARRQRHMRGRPITREEFEHMVAATDKVRPDDAGLWKGLLEGLWLSGLRLGEALVLSRDLDEGICIDLGGKYPCFVISAESKKGFRDRRLPMTPDSAELVLQTPVEDRSGKVFGTARMGFGQDRVGKVIPVIGKKPKVIVNKEQDNYASAHDLRRAFGTRWSSRVTPAVLQQLMRHASIDTTLKYYGSSQ